MEFGRFTPIEALKKIAKVVLFTSVLSVPQMAIAQSIDSQTIMVDCGSDGDVTLNLSSRGHNRITIKEI